MVATGFERTSAAVIGQSADVRERMKVIANLLVVLDL